MMAKRRYNGWLTALEFVIALILSFFVMMVPGMIAGILSAVLFFALPSRPLLGTGSTLLNYALILLTMLPLTWVIVRFAHGRKMADIGLNRPGKTGLRALGEGLLAGIVLFGLTAAPLYALGEYRMTGLQPGGPVNALVALLMFTFVAFEEELLARGYMLHAFRPVTLVGALLVSSGIFALLHGANANVTFFSLANIMLAGLLMGLMVWTTGNLWLAIGFHLTWNWMQGGLLGIPVSGMQIGGLLATEVVTAPSLLNGGAFGGEGSYLCTIMLSLGCIYYLWRARRSGAYKVLNGWLPPFPWLRID